MPAPDRNPRSGKSNEHRPSPGGPDTRQQAPFNPWSWWLVFAALLTWNLFAWWPSHSEAVNLPYSAFLAQVRCGNVAKVHIVGDEISGAFAKPLLWPPKSAAPPGTAASPPAVTH